MEEVMHQHWVFKIDPQVYSWEKLVEEKRTTWNSVKNSMALKELKNVRNGDIIAIFHDGDERLLVGFAEAISDPYKDPSSAENRFLVIDLRPIKKFARAVHLWELKNNVKLREFDLINIPELTVCPIHEEHWEEILHMAKERM